MTVAAQTDEQYTAATANITAGTYRIYAKSSDVKYFLKVKTGNVKGTTSEVDFAETTTSSIEASSFSITQTEDGSSKEKTTGWEIKYGNYYFSNPSGGAKDNNTFTPGICLRGHYNNRTSEYDRQVLYYDGTGYAVHACNTTSEYWGGATYWGLDGSNNACYVNNSSAQYIWHFEPVIETGYYLVKSTGLTSGTPRECYMTSNSSLYRSPRNAIYDGTDNADVWQLVDGLSSGYSLKSVKENTKYATLTSSASSSGVSFSLSETPQDWTFIPASSTEWYATDGSTNAYRYLNFNTTDGKGTGVWSIDNGCKFKLIPMSPYTLTIIGQTDATVTIATSNHKSAATNSETVYIDSDISSSSNLTVSAKKDDADAIAVITGFNTTNKTIEVMVGDYSRTFATANQKYTVCLPFEVNTTSFTNGTFYELSSYSDNDNTLHFTEVTGTTTIYKPYLFVPSTANVTISDTMTAYDAELHSANLTTSVSENAASFIGTMTAQSLQSDGTHTLYGYSSNGTFKQVSTTNAAHINPFRAYISIPGTSSTPAPAMLNINFGGNTTGIENAVQREEIKDKSYYDLQGRRVQQPTKGLYIVNGKKVIIK